MKPQASAARLGPCGGFLAETGPSRGKLYKITKGFFGWNVRNANCKGENMVFAHAAVRAAFCPPCKKIRPAAVKRLDTKAFLCYTV